MSNKETEVTKEPLKIKVVTPADFNSIGDIEITTTELLGKAINQLFAPAFDDYAGCDIKVAIVPNKGLVTEGRLIFKVLSEAEYSNPDGVFAFVPTSLKNKNTGNDLISKLNRITSLAERNVNSGITITEDGKSALSDFIISSAKNSNGEVRWNECTGNQNTGTAVFPIVFKLDISKIVAAIYGETDKDDTPLYYSVTPINQIAGVAIYGNNTSDTWALQILRLHHGEISKVCKIVGLPTPSEYNMPQMIPAER